MTLTSGELVKRAKKIELASRRLVDEQLAGQYHAVFKGRGLVFADVRPYYAGDDVRAIDWNITARMNAPHVKQFVEERDRTVNLVIDMSSPRSSRFPRSRTTIASGCTSSPIASSATCRRRRAAATSCA
jgi:uncharacterized protein (DUF58 family)